MDVNALLNWKFEDIEHSYSERDTMLYALGLGFGSYPTDQDELSFVYEDKLVACPSMAVILAYPGFWIKDPRTGVVWQKVLHGEQWLEVFKPLPAQGTVIGRTVIDHIADKGAEKGAVIYSSRDIIEKNSGDRLARVSMSTFCRGDGGFGGENKPGPMPAKIPERTPDATCQLSTLPQQALIYRLSGDYNPLHADPEIAISAGFRQPILHGMATYGLAGRAIMRTFCNYDPTRIKTLNVRFSAPVYPGETVQFEFWKEGLDVRFRANVPERKVVVLNNGCARLT